MGQESPQGVDIIHRIYMFGLIDWAGIDVVVVIQGTYGRCVGPTQVLRNGPRDLFAERGSPA
jgi:hypothetical protein